MTGEPVLSVTGLSKSFKLVKAVREVSFADTSLQYCPTCQTGGKPLADRRLSKLLR